MNGQPTYAEIVSSAKAEIAKLRGLIQDANDKVNSLLAVENRSPAQQDELNKLNEDRKALSASILRIDLVTLERLDRTAELQQLVDSLAAVRTDLEERRARILRFASKAEEVGTTLQGIADLATNVDNVRKKVKDLVKPEDKPKSQ